MTFSFGERSLSDDEHVISTKNMQSTTAIEKIVNQTAEGDRLKCLRELPSLPKTESKSRSRTKNKQYVHRTSMTTCRVEQFAVDEKMKLALKNRQLVIDLKATKAEDAVISRQQKTKEILTRRQCYSLENKKNLSMTLVGKMERTLSSVSKHHRFETSSNFLCEENQYLIPSMSYKELEGFHRSQSVPNADRDPKDLCDVLEDIEGWDDLSFESSSSFSSFIDKVDVKKADESSTNLMPVSNECVSEVINVIMVGTGSHDRFFTSSFEFDDHKKISTGSVEKPDLKQKKTSNKGGNEMINATLVGTDNHDQVFSSSLKFDNRKKISSTDFVEKTNLKQKKMKIERCVHITSLNCFKSKKQQGDNSHKKPITTFKICNRLTDPFSSQS